MMLLFSYFLLNLDKELMVFDVFSGYFIFTDFYCIECDGLAPLPKFISGNKDITPS